MNGNTFEKPEPKPEPVKDEDFQDVKLDDEAAKQQPKKKSFLSRFVETSDESSTNPESKSHYFHFPGRKRGQSGSGSELGEVKRPESKGTAEETVK